MRTRRWMVLTTLLVILAMVAGACSGEDASDTTAADGLQGVEVGTEATFAETADTTMAMEEAARDLADTTATTTAAEEGEADSDQPAGNGGVAPVVNGPVDLGRDIIFTAEMTVAVPDVAAAGIQAAQVIERFGGLLFGQETRGGSEPRTILTFKVLPEDFQQVLSELGSIGDLRNQNVSASDVTERVVDLRSRITTAEASVIRLRGFLENAQDLETIASLENQLLERETELERLRGQLRTLENQVALATIVLTLTEATVEPGILVESTFYPGHDDGGFACPGSGTLTVETDEVITACFLITNTGDTPLVDLNLVDSILDITIDDLTAVIGDPTAILLPGESVLLSHETTARGNIRTRTTVTATPSEPDGSPLDERPVASTVSATVQTEDPGGITSFSDGLAESWDLLISLGRVALLFLAWLLPFSWILVIGWLLWRRMQKSSREPAPAPPVDPERTKEPEPV